MCFIFPKITHIRLSDFSEREAHLQFQPAIVGHFGERTEAGAGRLIGLPKQWRRDVADDRTRVVMVRDIADVQRNRIPESPAYRSHHALTPRAADHKRPAGSAPIATAATWTTGTTAATRLLLRERALPRSAEGKRPSDPQIEHDLAGSASEIAGQQSFAGRRVRIEQAVWRRHHAGFVGVGGDAG